MQISKRWIATSVSSFLSLLVLTFLFSFLLYLCTVIWTLWILLRSIRHSTMRVSTYICVQLWSPLAFANVFVWLAKMRVEPVPFVTIDLQKEICCFPYTYIHAPNCERRRRRRREKPIWFFAIQGNNNKKPESSYISSSRSIQSERRSGDECASLVSYACVHQRV